MQQTLELSPSGQLSMRNMLCVCLKRVEWDRAQFSIRLYPFLTVEPMEAERPIAIDPGIAFGRPILADRGISTAIIAEGLDAGESVEDLAEDYDLSPEEIGQVVLHERAA